MKEKFKEFRDGLSLKQVEKIAAGVTVIYEIIFLICAVRNWEENVQVLLMGSGSVFDVVLILVMLMFLTGIMVTSVVWFIFDGGTKELQEKISKENFDEKDRVNEKFKLQSSEYTEIILNIEKLKGGEISKMLLEIEKKADIKYFACMSEDGERYFIICKMGEELIYATDGDNWRFLEANFEPKEPENETNET